MYSQYFELEFLSSACGLSQRWTIMAPVSKRRWTSNKIKQHQEWWWNEQIITQVSYSFSQSLPIYGESRYLYLPTYLHIHMPIYILVMPAEVLTHPLSNPFTPLPSCYPFSSPCFHTVVLSVERVINRATRWCCNTFWKHYRSACTLRGNARKPSRAFDIDHAGHVTSSAELAISSLSRSRLAELWSRRLHVPPLGFIKGSNILYNHEGAITKINRQAFAGKKAFVSSITSRSHLFITHSVYVCCY